MKSKSLNLKKFFTVLKRLALAGFLTFSVFSYGNDIKQLLEKLESEDSIVRHTAQRDLEENFSNEPKLFQEIVKRLDHKNPEVQVAAMEVLGRIAFNNPLDSEIQKQIVKTLEHENPDVRAGAVFFLGVNGKLWSESQKQIANKLKDKHPKVRIMALKTFKGRAWSFKVVRALGTNSNFGLLPLTIPQIAYKLKDEPLKVRIRLLKNLKGRVWGLNSKSNSALHSLTIEQIAETLEDKNPDVREAAIFALEQTETNDPSIHQKIAERLEDKHPKVREAAELALRILRPNGSPSIQEKPLKKNGACNKLFKTLGEKLKLSLPFY